MSTVQPSVAAERRGPIRRGSTRSPLNLQLVLGMGLIGLGVGMACLGIFHGLGHGSCSTTGYSGDYGPVQRCTKGVGWWMLMLMAGIVALGAGAVLARVIGGLIVPLVFVAIGAPFIALALGNHGQLLINTSSSTGRIFAGVFGGCFVIAGLVWGAFAARGITGVGGSSLVGGVLAAALGVGGAFAIAGGISSAIGKVTTPGSIQIAPGVTVSSAAVERAREISLCKSLVGGQTLIAAHERAVLTVECNANWKGAEHQIPAAARRGAVAQTTTRCRQGAQAGGLPAAAASTLASACGKPASTHGAAGLSLQGKLCRQIVKAQVPAAVQPQALASCPK